MKQKVNQLLSKVRESKGLQQTVISLIGNFFATGVSAITIILISRVLGPTQFGVFTVAMAVAVILSRVADAGLNATLLKFASDTSNHQKNNALFSYTIKLKLWLTLILAAMGMFSGSLLSRVLHFDQPHLISLAFYLVGFTVWYEQLVTMLQASQRFSQAVAANLSQSLAKLIGISILFLIGLKSSVFAFGWYMIAPVIPVLLFRYFVSPQLKIKLNQDFSLHRQSVLKMAKHSSVAFIAAGLIENVDVLIVQRYLTTYETGLLGGVSRISLMLLMIAYSLGNVLYPRVAQYKDQVNMARYLKKAVFMSVLALAGFLLFIPLSELSIILTIGPEYLAGTPILLILVASSFITLATIPFLALFYVFEKDWYFSVSGIGQLLIVVVGNYLLVPTMGLYGAAWTRFISRVFFFTFTIGLAIYIYRQKYLRAPTTSTET